MRLSQLHIFEAKEKGKGKDLFPYNSGPYTVYADGSFKKQLKKWYKDMRSKIKNIDDVLFSALDFLSQNPLQPHERFSPRHMERLVGKFGKNIYSINLHFYKAQRILYIIDKQKKEVKLIGIGIELYRH